AAPDDLRRPAARVLPAEAGVGDALAELERPTGGRLLAALDEVRFDHRADDAALVAGDLVRDVASDLDLALVVLRGVGVRAVDHQPLGEPSARQLLTGPLHARRVVVGLP